MAIFIEIRKHLDTTTGRIYKVFTNDFGGAKFYMEIDSKNRLISFYLKDHFLAPSLVVDCNKKAEKIDLLPGIDKNITGRVLIKGLKIINQDTTMLPEIIDYIA